jgi:DNA-binding GntR family transcriptional regulator
MGDAKDHTHIDRQRGGVSLRLPRDEPAPRAIHRRSLHVDITERLRDMIVESELAPRDRIDEKGLCELFQISRTPLREALKVLAFEGLVELLPNRGARVSQMTAREVLELFEVASGLERMAAELGAERAADAELVALRRMQERMERCHGAGRRSDYFRLNQRIHNSVIALARNSVLTESHAALMTRIRRARYQAIMSQERWDESLREHEELLEALEDRDGPRAGEILRGHVLRTGETICTVMESRGAHSNPRARGGGAVATESASD